MVEELPTYLLNEIQATHAGACAPLLVPTLDVGAVAVKYLVYQQRSGGCLVKRTRDLDLAQGKWATRQSACVLVRMSRMH